jgi:hypothetical protein
MNGNQSGRTAEDVIADLLTRHQCDFSRQVELGRSIYRTRLKADFVVHNFNEWPHGLAIECKWQDRAGTADEKLPYLVANIHAGAYGHLPLIIVVFGGGFRPGAIDWLREQISAHPFVTLLSLEGFMSWLQREGHVRVTSPTLPLTIRSNPG